MKKLFLSVFLILVLAACVSYQYGEVTYQTADAALNKMRSDTAARLANVQKSTNPIGGRAKVVVPNRTLIERDYIIKRGEVSADSIKYIVDVTEIDFQNTIDGIEKSELFDSVTEFKLNDTTNPSIEDYDYLIWMYAKKNNQNQWYVKAKSSEKQSPIQFDMGLQKDQRLNSMISSIEETILKLGQYKQPGGTRAQTSLSSRRIRVAATSEAFGAATES